MDFNCIRLMIVAGWVRVFLRQEYSEFRWIRADRLFLAWAVSQILVTGVNQGMSGMITRSGSHLFEQYGGYLLVRQLIRDWDDLVALVRAVCIIAIPCAFLFLLEWSTRKNVFSIFGGVPSVTIIRQGRLRCQGAFSHSIIAGCAWATWMPLISALWFWNRNQRWLVVFGLLATGFIVVSTASSTPVFAAGAAGLGMAFFPLRHHMRMVRWTVVAVLTFLHMIMNAPVWHLISRVSAVGGSTGYHRYKLIDNFINRVDEWWLRGTSTRHWGWGQQDVTNQLIVQGISGGMITFLLYVFFLADTFRNAGQTWRAVQDQRREVWLGWALGATIFAHFMAFIGVSYFGQGQFVLALHFALVSALYQTKCYNVQNEVKAIALT
jgi:hypothetical protein